MMPDGCAEGLCFFPDILRGGGYGHFAIIVCSTGSKIISQHSQRIAIIFNPFAGGLKGSKRSRLDRAAALFREAGRSVEMVATPGPMSAGELARELAASDRFDTILAAGGDGTINEAVNGLAGSRIVFGALPAGTANVLASEVGFSPRPDRAAQELLEAAPCRISLGRVEWPQAQPRFFLLMAGVGVDAQIVYDLDTNLKARIGKLAYWHGGFRQFGRPVPGFRFRIDGQEHHASFALLTRVRNYGGDFNIARRVRITDDDFEVVLFDCARWADYLRFFVSVVRNRLDRTEGVTLYRASEAAIEASGSDRVYVQADGEAVGRLPVTVRSIPDALTLLLPKVYARG